MANEMPKDRLLFLFTDRRTPPSDYITSVQAHDKVIQRGVTRPQLLSRSFPRYIAIFFSNAPDFVRVPVSNIFVNTTA